MSIGLRQIPLSELIRRVAERTGRNNWIALVVPDDEATDVVEQIAYGVAAESSTPVERLDEPANADALENDARRTSILIIPILDEWPEAEWARLDTLRSRLQREHSTVLVLSESASRQLLGKVPHFANFFGGSVWELEPYSDDLTETERVARVRSLESWAHMTTDEMVDRAERKDLPPDPEFAEWLVLVHRSDLL